MANAVLSHPPSEQLRDFGLGRLEEPESAEIESHLSACSDCRRVVEELPADSLVELLQESHAEATASPSGASQTGLYKRLAAIIRPGDAATKKSECASSIPPELQAHPRYEILELLGAGGMGTVYKARHRLMDRLVALKMMNTQLLAKGAAVERFVREMKTAAQLVHPHIVTAYDAERVADMHFLVMEFVEGQTLARVVLERGALPVHQACDYVRQAALGLQHACERHMAHRDIKPHNLILTTAGQVKILDFGLARFLSESGQPGEHTAFGTLMGSPDYMAPEQARDPHSADIRADIYGLGCTLYNLLTGQVPFPGGTAVEKLSAHLERTPTPLAQIRPDVADGVRAVVERMMVKDPAERYQTPAEVVDALTPFCTPTAGVGPVPRIATRPRRRLALYASLALVLALPLLVLIGVGVFRMLAPLRAVPDAGPDPAAAASPPGGDDATELGIEPNAGTPKDYAWPPDKLKEGKVLAPDFSKVKPLLDENFENPQKRLVGREIKSDSFDNSFEKSRYVIRYKGTKSMAYATAPATLSVNHAFAFQVTARATGELTDGWGITIVNARPVDRAVNIKIARDGSVRFDGWFLKMADFPGDRPAPLSHKQIKSGDEDNTLLAVLRGRHLELYVNGAAVCDPLTVDQDMLPAGLLITARPDHKGARAEFKRVTLWSAEQVPSLEARGAKLN